MMDVNDDTFFMVQLPEGKTLHQTKEEAISQLQQQADGLEAESSDVNIVKIAVEDDDWTIAEMSWQTIALQLMGE
ncbi:hypothetical protein [Halorhabdus sp. BNX81]|uniref:hypothetical protein n=1 Tax=Halorhabdus sp. BNX81 TaxID=2980181 RepID=UPI0023DD2966|nr:hypothetical protein [Halorhabdus sp. BNX81]